MGTLRAYSSGPIWRNGHSPATVAEISRRAHAAAGAGIAAGNPALANPPTTLVPLAEYQARARVCAACTHRVPLAKCGCGGLCAHPQAKLLPQAEQPTSYLRRTARCPEGKWAIV